MDPVLVSWLSRNPSAISCKLGFPARQCAIEGQGFGFEDGAGNRARDAIRGERTDLGQIAERWRFKRRAGRSGEDRIAVQIRMRRA